MSPFVDQARIVVKAGRGGDGASHFRREKYVARGGPDGGDGGRGGHVILVVDPDLRTLIGFSHEQRFFAPDGAPGEGGNRTGANGLDLTVPVPLGTLVYDDDSGELLADLATPGQSVVVCRGGRGGFGNAHYATPQRRAPTMRELGEPGEQRTLRLELKLLADAALVGYPNVGKSTLIARLSAARPKIADYPFTTLTPNLGVVRVDDRFSYVIADLPGLIEGAADGRGLGHQFLRHLERARVIVHVVDLSGIERPDPVADYQAIRNELSRYDPRLAALPELVVGNKLDLPDAPEMAELLAEELRGFGVERFYPVSAATGEGLDSLRSALAKAVTAGGTASLVEQRALETVAAGSAAPEPPFVVGRDDDGLFVVSGHEVERAVAMCDLANQEAVMHLHRALTRMGVLDALRTAGCEDGDLVRIADVVLEFQE